MPRRKSKLPKIKVRGVGMVEVTRLPKRVPKTITIFGKEEPVKKQDYLEVWALAHQTKADQKMRDKKFREDIHKGKGLFGK